MSRWKKLWIIAAVAVTAAGCKDVVSPHMKPEGDPSRLVASMAAATNQALMARAGADQQVVLTINNAPEANEPLEQDFLTELVELFEKRNPNIRIQYSPWQYTPESFFERLNNRTLTDIVEVDAAQMAPIIEANAAADLTENVRYTPEIRIMNPDVFTVASKDGRTYGVPTQLHTLALFYNRRLLEDSKIVIPNKKPEDKEKGKGADGDPRDYILQDLPQPLNNEPVEVAQYGQSPYYPPGYQAPAPAYGRGQREMESYYNQRPRQPQPQQTERQRREAEYYQQQQEYYRKHGRYFHPSQRPRREEDARERRVQSRKSRDEESTTRDDGSDTSERSSSESTSRSTRSRSTAESDSKSTETLPDDTLTTEAEIAMQEEQTVSSDAVTSVILTSGLPTDLEQFIRLAVRLTDHKKGIYGFAPVLYASEGGREYTQWAVQAGLEMQKISGSGDSLEVTLDVDQSGEVAQFLKDLHVRFDVTPPPAKCYYDNLMTMYAEGKLAMMIMPADGNTISELLKREMPLEDLGIAPLPHGLVNRDHLTYGKCLVINSQLDQSQRAAAFKWLMFMASPEVQRMRAQFFFREGELTAPPSVPLYSGAMQAEHYASLRPFRSLPLWSDYESVIARNLHLEPSFHTDRFYEALAEGLRPIIERRDSDPFHAVTLIATDFERKYIRLEKPANPVDRFVQFMMEKKEN